MATNNSNEQIRNISIQDRQAQNTAADWARQLRFSNDVNMSTVGVDTDRVTPDLLMATSKKLLGISRGQQQGDAKDSLRYQKVYGPVEYFAQHVQRDGGSVARSLLWKATNKGNLNFIGSGSLQPHVSSVFNESNLTRFVDNSTPFQGVDASMLLTRVGQGGINSDQSAPIEMRLVQPSYYGYVGGVRTQDKSPGITAYLSKNVMKGTDGKLYQKFYNPRTGKEQLVDSQKAAASVVTTNQYMNTKDKYVYALGGDKGVRIVPRSSVDYILPRADEAWSTAANVVPMMSGVKSLRLNMGCLHPQTPVPFIDEQGFTDLVPAKRLGSYGDSFLYGCDQKGYQKLYKLQGVYSRFPDFNRPFKRVITASGRVLVTSPDHKWYVYQGGKYKKITADKLQQGMLIPRSTFFKLPTRLTTIFGVTITKEICVLIGRLLKSYEETPKTRRFTYVVNETVNQQPDIIQALKQLNIIGSNFYQREDIHYVSISDVRLIDWIETEMKSKEAQRKIPKAILSLPKGMTSYVLDSYCKQRENVGQDIFGDIWLLDIPSPIMRDGLSLMLGKIFTDTYYRDSYKNGKQYRALKLIESENQGNVYLEPIKKILDEPAPAFMVDLDCDDHVYAVGNGIITHNSKYISQAVALQKPEAPLVRSLDEASGKDMDTLIGKFVGAQFSPKPGIVQAVRKDRIDMLYDDGTKGSVGLYDNFPANAKGWLSNYPMVKAGQRVGEGQLLAKSNYTDDKGVAAMGRNLHIGYMSYHGGTYEDACTISESAAKKMAYTTMYKTGMDTDKSIRSSKTLYNAWKPGEYTKQQMQKLDDKGVVKVGQVLHKGDPMILGIRTNQPSPGTMGKRILTDVSQVWDHAHQGVVTDVVKTRDGIKVYAKVSAPLQVGDKISGRWGNKGTIAQIIPDDKMPRDEKGVPLDVLMDPLGIVSRTNPSQLIQAGLGKLALKTGQPIVVPQFMPKGQSRLQWAKQLLKKNNISMHQTVFDPDTNKNVSNVFTGYMYFLPLKHIADTKMSARGTDTYTAEGIPAGGGEQGSKRIGGLQVAGLVGHNAFDFLTTDAKLIRGQSNAQFWRSLRTGEVPVIPGQPLVHKKFFAHLQGSGMHIRKTPKGISVMALTNKDVNQLAGNRELKSKDTYQQKTFREIDGGLFGKDIFGADGNKWGYIQLDEPLPNPVMQQPLARLLRMSDQQFQNVVSGKQEVNGLKNSSDIQKALSKIDLKAQRVNALKQLKEASASKRDAALKRYVAIARMQDNGTQPSDYMLNKIPVLPPEFRPITTQGNLTMVADSNYLYAQLLDARDDQRQAKTLTPELQNEARGNIYKRWKQLVGLYDPQSKKLQSKSVKGLLRWALGTTPKFGGFQRKVLGSTVDTVGRGVVVPDSKLKLNQIGLPQAIAWNIYSPFISRKLVQAGYTPVNALKLTKEKNVRAKDALMQAMQEHPTVMNRAPSLHKLSLMGFQPVLTTGYAIKVNPSIVSPFGMDFDGDSVWNKVQIYTDLKGLTTLLANSQDEDMLQYVQNKKERCSQMLSTDTKIKVAHAVCSLSDIPHKEESEVIKSNTVTEWDVDGDFYVNTIDLDTGATTLARMTKVSRHTGLKMYDCTLSISKAYSHVVTASEDHSLITLNPNTLELEKTKPVDATGRCVPMLRKEPINDSDTCLKYIKLGKAYPMSYDMGVFLGMMIGDGWVDNELKAKLACCEPSLQNYILKVTEPKPTMPFTKQATLYSYAPDKARFGQTHNQDLFLLTMEREDRVALKELIGAGALNKRIPLISFCGSRSHLIGILCGLLATDGHIGVSSTSKKKASIKNIAYHTISPDLRDGIQLLCSKLGIKTRVTPYKGANSKSTCYEIGFCLEDIAELKTKYSDQFIIPVEYKEKALQEICSNINKGVKNSFDIVPFPKILFCEFSWAKAATIHKDTVITARAKGYIKRSHAKDIAEAMKNMDWEKYVEPANLKTKDKSGHTAAQAKEFVSKWIKLVEDKSVGWEVVDDVTESTLTEGWDCTVPGPYTFTLSTGTVVQDTVNIHVPVSKAAIKQVRNNMFPQRNLISARKHKILYAPQKAFMQGLYVATRMGDSSKGVKTFHSIQQAKQAYKNNQIDIDTPIVISK